MKLHYTILYPSWVWLYYFDEHKRKHLKELFDEEAEKFINDNKQ